MPHNCRPPPGQAYLTIGQDFFAISDYLESAYNASLHVYLDQWKQQRKQQPSSPAPPPPPPPRRSENFPAAFMAYSDLATLAGLTTPTDYGTGVEYAKGLAELLQPMNDVNYAHTTTATTTTGLQLGLWLGGADGCQAVVNGTWATQITRFVHYVATAPFYRVFVRLGYEFDNPSFGYYPAPDQYQQAWRILVQACRRDNACRTKGLFVWHSWGAGLQGNATLSDFYPGEAYVDWMGVSIFQQVYHNNSSNNSSSPSIWSGGSYETLLPVLEFARAHDKPLMIAESTPFGWGVAYEKDVWERWFVPVLNLLQEYRDVFAMWSYIDCNWEAQPMWHGVGFGDTRAHRNATVQRLWRQHVMEKTLGYGSLQKYCAVSSSSQHPELADIAAPWSNDLFIIPPQFLIIAGLLLALVVVALLGRRRRQHRPYEVVP